MFLIGHIDRCGCCGDNMNDYIILPHIIFSKIIEPHKNPGSCRRRVISEASKTPNFRSTDIGGKRTIMVHA